MKTWDARILDFLGSLQLDVKFPKGFAAMNPYKDPVVMGFCKKFYSAYYHDTNERTLLLGINPGRFGSGTTGISFTDPIRLERDCGIRNSFQQKPELSSDFIYRMIDACGGVAKFYSRFFISAVSPLGFLLNHKNVNYYDDPRLQKAVTPFITHTLQQTIDMGVNRKVVFCIGEGKNLAFLTKINHEHKWFERIEPLPHPRFIMQYRRKKVEEYVERYCEKLSIVITD